jgi:hypothetical protein
MKRAFIWLLLPLTLAACGAGNTSTGTTNGTTNSGGGNSANEKAPPANTPNNTDDDGKEEPPKEDPDKHKKVSGAVPADWRALTSKDARGVLERHFKVQKWEFVNGILNSKPPGATEGDKEWGEWEHKAAGAMLYFVSDKQMAPKAAVEAYAKDLAAGVPEIKEDGGLAWTQMQGGEVLVFGISNKYGTYVAVGVVLTTDPEPAREAIQKWAQSVKPE